MAKYKVGDKVIVRKDLDEAITMYWMDDKDDWWYATDKMVDAAGQTVTIKGLFNSGGKVLYYICEGFNDHDDFWTDEMFVGLAEGKEETPMPKKEEHKEFKVGDRVRCVKANWGKLKVGDLGTVIDVKEDGAAGVEFDNEVGGHDCYGKGKDGHCWWQRKHEIELVKEEPKPEPTPEPTPIIVNITVNLYENACWYCRKGGLVDLYLAGAMGICPSCKRVCNATNALPKAHKPSNPWKKENRALTKEEFDALPVGTKVYIVWCWDLETNRKGKPRWKDSGWGVKEETMCVWTDARTNKCRQSNETYDRCFDAYLEEPERPK